MSDAAKTKRITGGLVYAALLGAGVIVYFHGLRIPWFADDYELRFIDPKSVIFWDFFHKNPINQFYRPLQTMVMGMLQVIWGYDTLPLRISDLMIHAATAWLVFHALKYWRFSNASAAIAAVFVIVSQMSEAAVLGNDTQTQLTDALFTTITLWLVYRWATEGGNERSANWRYYLSWLTCLLALISKETSATLGAKVAFIMWIALPANLPLKQKAISTLKRLIPFAVATVLYLILREITHARSAHVGENDYAFHFGLNILTNCGMTLFQSVLPVSSLTVMRTLYYHNIFLLVVIGLFTSVFGLIIVNGLRRSPRRMLVLALLALMILSWTPAVFLIHISELYAYNAVPYIAALIGIAAEYYMMMPGKSPAISLKYAGIGVILFALVTNAIGADDKARSMKEMGDRADALLPQIIERVKPLPPNGRLYLVNPDENVFEYSMFTIHGFRVITCVDTLIQTYSGRPDIGTLQVDKSAYPKENREHPGEAITYDPKTRKIEPYPQTVFGKAN